MASAVLLLTSCSKDLESRLEGKWNVDKYEYKNSAFPDFNTTITNDGTIEFRGDGTGVAIDKNGESDNFTWSSTDDKVTIKVTGQSAIVFTSVTNKRKQQVLEHKETSNVGSTTVTQEIRFELSK